MIQDDRDYYAHRSDYNDEIDLYDILMKIWKWKGLISIIVVTSTLLVFLYFLLRPIANISQETDIAEPEIYSTEADIKIGKVSNVLIEQLHDIILYSTSSEFIDKIERPRKIRSYVESIQFLIDNESDFSEVSKITTFAESKKLIGLTNLTEMINLSDLNPYSLNIKKSSAISISISCSSYSPHISYALVSKTIDLILKRHERVYAMAVKRIRENINLIKSKEIINPVFLIDSYTYMTSVITMPEFPEDTDGKQKKPTKPPVQVNRWSGVPLKLAVIVFASLFFGVFLSLFIDYIITERDKRRMEQK